MKHAWATNLQALSWVTQVLDKCPQCCSPTPGACTVLAKVQQDWAAKHSSDNPAADGSASSGWSAAEGSSEDISSADDQMGGPVKSETAAVEKGVVVKSGLPSLVLVGDSNALGHCETRDYNNSLRKSLSAAFQVQVAAKSGTSWRVLAQDVDASLAQFLREDAKRKNGSDAIASSPQFERVVFVLGTNDVPKHKALPSTWAKLPENIVTVLKAMEKYVQKSQSPTPGLQSVFVTTPFNFDRRMRKRLIH